MKNLTEFKDRLASLLEQKNGGNQSDLARFVGVTPQAVQAWVSGRTAPRKKQLEKIAVYLDTTDAYLMYGIDGDEHFNKVREQILQQTSEPILTTDIDVETKIWVDLMDIKFSCGDGESIDFHFETIEARNLAFDPSFFRNRRVKPENARFARAKGDSMFPFIKDRDVFGMDISDTVALDGEVYAVYFEGEAMLKQIFKEDGGKLVLHSLNPAYKDRIVGEHNGSSFQIIGRQFYRSG